jgi:uncharacterized membrane protein YeaQ/YmgE (transglycosylase-associated protein family)
VIAGLLLTDFYGTGGTGFGLESLLSCGAAIIGAVTLLAAYHAFFRHRML